MCIAISTKVCVYTDVIPTSKRESVEWYYITRDIRVKVQWMGQVDQ